MLPVDDKDPRTWEYERWLAGVGPRPKWLPRDRHEPSNPSDGLLVLGKVGCFAVIALFMVVMVVMVLLLH